MKTKLDELKEKATGISTDDEKNVFVEVAPAPEIYTVGKNTFMDEMLEVHSCEKCCYGRWLGKY